MDLGSSYDEGWRQSCYHLLCFAIGQLRVLFFLPFFFLDSVGVRKHSRDQNITTSSSYIHQREITKDTNFIMER